MLKRSDSKVHPCTFESMKTPKPTHNTGSMRRRFASWPAEHLLCGQTSYMPGTLFANICWRYFWMSYPATKSIEDVIE